MQTKNDEQTMRTAEYAFLSTSPPPQRKKPHQSSPSLPISVVIPVSASTPANTSLNSRTGSIAAWAAHVQPGSPAPCSPYRRPSLTPVRRRISIPRCDIPSGSLSELLSSSSPGQGVYSSVFLHLPPTQRKLTRTAMETPAATQTPSSKKPSAAARTIKHFRSLGIICPPSKSTTSRTLGPASTTEARIGTRARAELISKHKKAKYAPICRPPPLANEIALMQFADGGSVESNVRRMMEGQARAASGNLGVNDVYRDEKGGLWWDKDEEMEYTHLLGEDAESENVSEWIRFGDDKCEDESLLKPGILDLVDSKRGSSSTQDSELCPEYLVLPVEESQCGPEDVVLSFDVPPQSPFKKLSTTTAGLSVLSLPSRPRRTAKHLRKPVFLVDVAAFGPRSPDFKIYPFAKSDFNLSPSCLTPIRKTPDRFSSVFVFPPASGDEEGKKKTRKRPAPLKLETGRAGRKEVEVFSTPISLSRTMTMMTTSSVGVESKARREFVEASFVSPPILHHIPASSPSTMQSKKPQRGKTIVASLNPMDDMARCRRWAEMMTDQGDVYGVVDVSKNRPLEGVTRKKRLGFGRVFKFGRK